MDNFAMWPLFFLLQALHKCEHINGSHVWCLDRSLLCVWWAGGGVYLGHSEQLKGKYKKFFRHCQQTLKVK